MIIYSNLTIQEKLEVALASKEERTRLFDSAIAREGNEDSFTVSFFDAESFGRESIVCIDDYLAQCAPCIFLTDKI